MQKHIVANGDGKPPQGAGLVSVKKFRADLGVSNTTVWRWSRAGWLTPINICGRPYLKSEDVAQFRQRAAAGEFAREHKGACAEKPSTSERKSTNRKGGVA